MIKLGRFGYGTEPFLASDEEHIVRVAQHLRTMQLTKRVNKKHSSYFWKHVVEKQMGEYLPNGVFIAAAKMAKLQVEPHPDGMNAYVSISEWENPTLRKVMGRKQK